MLDIQLFRENPDLIRHSLQRRGSDTSIVDQVIDLDHQRRALLQQVESLRSEKNQASKAIGQSKDPDERQASITAMKALGEDLEKLDAVTSPGAAIVTFGRDRWQAHDFSWQ